MMNNRADVYSYFITEDFVQRQLPDGSWYHEVASDTYEHEHPTTNNDDMHEDDAYAGFFAGELLWYHISRVNPNMDPHIPVPEAYEDHPCYPLQAHVGYCIDHIVSVRIKR